mmetsp:Transcript_29797/g.90179  ORF Transcript_29797/g.90179 Transcript_29797/m.90179 type:complete len:418 (+) Transcript_29797:1056-2309(+)
MPQRIWYIILPKLTRPLASIELPIEVLWLPSTKGASSPLARNVWRAEMTSDASARNLPAAWHSMTSTSDNKMSDALQASLSKTTSAGPLGAVKPADFPLFMVCAPVMVPASGKSSLTRSPSTKLSGLARTTATPVASPLTCPSADASKEKQRPPGERNPDADIAGHQAPAITKLTPMAQASSCTYPGPFFSTDSEAKYTQLRPDAASVSIARLAPLQPKQKLSRPAQILGEPPVAPKIPTSADRSALFHSVVPMPTYIPQEALFKVLFFMPLFHNASYVHSSTCRCEGSMPFTSAMESPNILLSKRSMPSAKLACLQDVLPLVKLSGCGSYHPSSWFHLTSGTDCTTSTPSSVAKKNTSGFQVLGSLAAYPRTAVCVLVKYVRLAALMKFLGTSWLASATSNSSALPNLMSCKRFSM